MNIFKKIYIRTSGYSYTHMGRLFLRFFVGIMLLQFGVRQWMNFASVAPVFPEVLGMSSAFSLGLMIAIEIVCSLFIMVGCLTRLMVIPPFIAMICAEVFQLQYMTSDETYMLNWYNQGYLPMMFLGIYFFILMVGPGKISVDYFLSLHFIHTNNHSESELEEV